MRCSCEDSKNNLSEFPDLEAILPANYLYTVCESSKIGENHTDSTFRINVATKEEALSWIEEFNSTSNSTFNKDRTFPENCQRHIFKVYLKCVHNTRPRSSVKQPHHKHTNCPAKLLVTIKRTRFSKKNYQSQSTDVHLPSHPMIVTYRNKHNHNLYSADVIKYHPLKPDVKTIFLSSFEEELTPAETFEDCINNLKELYGENYKALADDSIYLDVKKNDVSSDWFYPLVSNNGKNETSIHNSIEPRTDHNIVINLSLLNDNEDVATTSHNRVEDNFKDNEEQKKKVIEDFLNFSKVIADKAKNNDETFSAIKKFLENAQNLKTDSSLNSSLYCFGKFNDFFDSKKRKKKFLTSLRKIRIQNTALAKRKT